MKPADYGKFGNIGPYDLSPDGRWLFYTLNRSSGQNELRLQSTDGEEQPLVIPFGEQAAFSDDSRWLAAAIGYSEDEREKLTKAKKPVHNKMRLVRLATRAVSNFDGIQSFRFSKGGGYLAMRRYPAEKPAAPPDAPPVETPPAGSDLIVRDLASGTDMVLGNVTAFAWSDKSPLLAFTVHTEGLAGNGVYLLDPATSVMRALDTSQATYSGLAWRKDHDDLAALRSIKDDKHEGESHALLAWRGAGAPKPARFTFDPTQATGFSRDNRIVKFRPLQWSHDGKLLFAGTKRWEPKAPKADKKNEDEQAGVEVWHSADVNAMPEQKLRAQRDRERNRAGVWHIDGGRFIPLGSDSVEEVTVIRNSTYALGRDERALEKSRMFGRESGDYYAIELGTGKATPITSGVRYMRGASPGGRYILWFQRGHYWAYDMETGTAANISAKAKATFSNVEDDHPSDDRAPFGTAGWTRDDASVWVYDLYDIWELAADGSKAVRLTDGARSETRYRYLRLDPKEEFIDPARPAYLSAFGRWSKASGFARLNPGKAVEPLLFEDRSLTRLAKAREADVFAWVSMKADDPPDIFAGAGFTRAKQVTDTNPTIKDYAWSRTEKIEFKNSRNQRLQGILHYPANYERHKLYPMIVYIYERLSDGLHNFHAPSERNAYNPAVFTAQGYFVLMPDITYRYRDPGVSAVDCLRAAVNKVVERGLVDRKRIGITGHSWGGYQTVYLATQNLFAAAVAGAPLTNLVSMYGSVFWNNGRPETDHFEFGQERMEVPLWQDREAYIRNSPVFLADKMNTPLLVAFGDKDGSVDWHQGLEMYNASRRLGKQMVLLVYPGENHSNRRKPNQVDYHYRALDWFNHYLKGEAPKPWIKNGVSFLEREQELKKLKDTEPKKPEPALPSGASPQ